MNDPVNTSVSVDNTGKELVLVKPFVPPIEELLPYLDRIRKSRHLTNGGPVHAELEQALCDFLGVKNICLFANGTLALMIALRSLRLTGEVITTPFTSPATIQAIYWNNLKPVFVDIRENDLNIDAGLIEAAITPQTSAILPVHIFGTPCDVERIGHLARKHDLKVIYDAAHCFGVGIRGDSICNSGDMSVLSFHATKVFNTLEGGAIVFGDQTLKKHVDALKNTGLGSDHNLMGYGINSKMNEIQAAFGLCQLKYMDGVIASRRAATMKYRELLAGFNGLILPEDVAGVRHNYSYFPVIIEPDIFGAGRDELYDHLKIRNIATRKYFYPLACDFTEFEMYKTTDLPIAQRTAKRILCIPLFHDISEEQIRFVVHSISELYRGSYK